MSSLPIFKKLFEPTKIGEVTIKNRLAMAPMGISSLCDTEGTVTQRAVDYYTERAKGGTGLIITGLSRVENEIERFGHNTQFNLSLNPAHFVQTSFELTESVHSYGAKIFIQLTAGLDGPAAPAQQDLIQLRPQPSQTTGIPLLLAGN